MKLKILDGQAYEIVQVLPGGLILRGLAGMHTGTFIEEKEVVNVPFQIMPSVEKTVLPFP